MTVLVSHQAVTPPFYNKITPMVLGTTLNEMHYVKFEMAKSRCRANASFLIYVRKSKTF